jgi:hypothetical protein
VPPPDRLQLYGGHPPDADKTWKELKLIDRSGLSIVKGVWPDALPLPMSKLTTAKNAEMPPIPIILLMPIGHLSRI